VNINRTVRLWLALLLLLSSSALCAAPPDAALPAAPTSSAASEPAAIPIASNGKATAAQSHQAPPAVAAHPDATPKEQAAVVANAPNPADASGFRLMTLSNNALLSRVSLADQAQHTIDLQYYEFENDPTGRLVALHLLEAADRGVHVRILLDDLHLKDEVRMFEGLASNPNIEVRLFNPFNSPSPSAISKTLQLVLEFRRLNRRMHNKCFIVDNEVAVIGGRNIGDEYFDASADNNFRDLDVIAIGPVVPAATRSFEAYWNSDAAHPIAEFRAATDPATDLVALRATLEKSARTFDQTAYKQEAADDLPNGASADRPGDWFWGRATFVADQPEKIDNGPDRRDLRIGPEIKGLIKAAQSEVLMISPYFVPSDQDEKDFVAIAQRGVSFKVLTNSLASTDEVAVYEGYSRHRVALLEGRVQLFELKPAPGVRLAASDAGRSSGVSLHAKSFVVDERYVFIGSMNMDPRSKLLNTEMGVIVDSPLLAKAVANFFKSATVPANAYHVVLGAADGSHPHEMRWETTTNGKAVEYDHEPDASIRRHLQAKLIGLLPITGLL
jgi:putative cardiolipin synthase